MDLKGTGKLSEETFIAGLMAANIDLPEALMRKLFRELDQDENAYI